MNSKAVGRIPWATLAAEFLVIFAGVTLSLIADDWRQSREDAGRERMLLESLKEDLAADTSGLRSAARSGTSHAEGTAWLLYRFENGPPVPVDSIPGRIQRILGIATYRPVMSTYTALREGGQLTLIQNPTTRRAVTEYYEGDVQGLLRQTDYWEQGLVRVRDAVRPYWDSPREDSLPTRLFQFRLLRPWDELRSDRALRGHVADLGIAASVAAGSLRSVVDRNLELQLMIDAELARR